MGITQDELEKYFAPFLDETAEALKVTEKDLLEKKNTTMTAFPLTGRQGSITRFPPSTFSGIKSSPTFGWNRAPVASSANI
jgi:hypothetical protein